MVADFMSKDKPRPPKKVEDLHLWFPAETPEPPAEASQSEDLGRYLTRLPWIFSVDYLPVHVHFMSYIFSSLVSAPPLAPSFADRCGVVGAIGDL